MSSSARKELGIRMITTANLKKKKGGTSRPKQPTKAEIVAFYIKEDLKYYKNLEYYNTSVYFTSKRAIAFANHMSHSKDFRNVKSIIFSGLYITDAVAIAIANALVYVSTDNTTDAVVTGITNHSNNTNPMRGILHIPSRLSRMPQEVRFPHLRTLMICSGDISDIGICAIMSALRFYTNLTRLDISNHHNVGEKGVRAIIKALGFMTNLEKVGIGYIGAGNQETIYTGTAAIKEGLIPFRPLEI